MCFTMPPLYLGTAFIYPISCSGGTAVLVVSINKGLLVCMSCCWSLDSTATEDNSVKMPQTKFLQRFLLSSCCAQEGVINSLDFRCRILLHVITLCASSMRMIWPMESHECKMQHDCAILRCAKYAVACLVPAYASKTLLIGAVSCWGFANCSYFYVKL